MREEERSRAEPGSGGDSVPGAGESSAPPARPLTTKDLERIIHRAAELQFVESEPGGDVLDEEEVLRIGHEVGLPAHHVRRALSEVRAEAMLPDLPEDPPSIRRLLGAGAVRVARVVPDQASAVQDRVEAHFLERESLAEVRRRPGFSLWEPAGGVRAHVQRAVNWEGRGYELAKAGRIELAVSPTGEGWSLAVLTADLRNVRREHVLAWSASNVFVFGSASLVVGLTSPVPLALAFGAGLAGTAGGSLWGTRATFSTQRERVRLRLEGLLDRLERGSRLDEPRPGRRLRG